MQKIPVHIITGFLGAGKTSVLNHLISAAAPDRMFVIENEVGEVGIDGSLVVGGVEDMIELSAGCLCCSLHGDLRNALELASEKRGEYQRLIIETTGVAKPGSIAQLFLADPGVSRVYELQNVICVVDALHIEHWLQETEEALRQIAIADLILLNKADCVAEAQLRSTQLQVSSINPYAKTLVGSFGRFPVAPLFNTETTTRVEALIPDLQNNTGEYRHQNITTFTLSFRHSFKLKELSFELRRLASLFRDQIYRIKGVISIPNYPNRVIIQCVRSSIVLTDGAPWLPGETRLSQVVVIGVGLERQPIEKIFQRNLVPGAECPP